MSNETFNAMLRRDPASFLAKTITELAGRPIADQPPYLHLYAFYMQMLATGTILRLCVSAPPRTFKSMAFSRALIPWMLGRDPSMKIVLITHSRELSSEILRVIRTIISEDWFRTAFPALQLSKEKNNEHEVETTAGGRILATSSDSGITGRGADMLIFDDYNAAEEAYTPDQLDFKYELYRSKYLTRLDDQSTGRVVIVQQRLAEGDLVGRACASGGYTELVLPLVAERDECFEHEGRVLFSRPANAVLEPRAVPNGDLEKLIRQVGERTFAAHYQQHPLAQQGAILRPGWLPLVDAVSASDRVVLSIDTATSLNEGASYSVIEAWSVAKDEAVTLVDVVRGRFDYPTLVSCVIDTVSRHKPAAVLVEDMNVGTSIAAEVERLSRGLAVRCKPSVRKEERLQRHLNRFHSGQVRIQAGAFWTSAFLDEVLSFPSGRYSDQTDAMTQLLDWLDGKPALIRRDLVTHGFSMRGGHASASRSRSQWTPNPMRDPRARFILR